MGIDDQNNAELDLCHLLLHMHTLRITSVRGSVAGTAGCQRVDSRQLAVSHTYQLTYQNYHPRFPHVQTLFQISTDAPHRQASAPAAHLSLVASKILEPYDAQNELRTKAMSILGLRAIRDHASLTAILTRTKTFAKSSKNTMKEVVLSALDAIASQRRLDALLLHIRGTTSQVYDDLSLPVSSATSVCLYDTLMMQFPTTLTLSHRIPRNANTQSRPLQHLPPHTCTAV
jgi:hypothetical protein